jgi:hypothetical protein
MLVGNQTDALTEYVFRLESLLVTRILEFRVPQVTIRGLREDKDLDTK